MLTLDQVILVFHDLKRQIQFTFYWNNNLELSNDFRLTETIVPFVFFVFFFERDIRSRFLPLLQRCYLVTLCLADF